MQIYENKENRAAFARAPLDSRKTACRVLTGGESQGQEQAGDTRIIYVHKRWESH